MIFPAVVFDQMIRELGEIVQLRDQALRHRDSETSPHTAAALQALKLAVSAVGRVAEVGDRPAEVDAARRAMAEARRLFAEVASLPPEAPRPPAERADPPPEDRRARRSPAPTKCA
jgi:hypothetical protein